MDFQHPRRDLVLRTWSPVFGAAAAALIYAVSVRPPWALPGAGGGESVFELGQKKQNGRGRRFVLFTVWILQGQAGLVLVGVYLEHLVELGELKQLQHAGRQVAHRHFPPAQINCLEGGYHGGESA